MRCDGLLRSSYSRPLRFGYAGGLSPSNLKQQLDLIDATAPVCACVRACVRVHMCACACVGVGVHACGTCTHTRVYAHGTSLPRMPPIWRSLPRRAHATPAPPTSACYPQGRTLWVDMETSLRTHLKDNSDIFDANKAMACVRIIIDEGRVPKAA